MNSLGDPLTECGGVCRDTATDPNYCGDCATSCNDGEVCVDGDCAASCGEGLTACNGQCVDLDADPAHCGACNDPCVPTDGLGAWCDAGSCRSACEPGSPGCVHFTLAGSGTVASPYRATPDVGSCQAFVDTFGALDSGVYRTLVGGFLLDVYCDQQTDGGGWALLAKIWGTNPTERWRYGSAAWTGDSTFGDTCVLSTTSGCDGKSALWASASIGQLQVRTRNNAGSSVTGLYDLETTGQTMMQRYQSRSFATDQEGELLAVRYTGTAGPQLGMADWDGEATTATSSDRCMFNVRYSIDNQATGSCAGRIRGVTTATFVYYPASIDSSTRADHASMNNGGGTTFPDTMLVFGR